MKARQGVETLGVHIRVWLVGIREGTRHLSTMGRRILAGFLWYVILQKVHCQHGLALPLSSHLADDDIIST